MSSDPLEWVTRKWWITFAGFGVAIVAAALAAGSLPWQLIGGGLVTAMLGEAVNRPFVQQVTHVDGWGMARQMASGYPYRPRRIGLLLNAAGAIAALSGFALILAAGIAQALG